MIAPKHGDGGRTGKYEVSKVPRRPKVRWRFPTAAPVVGGLAMAGDTLYFGDATGAVYAVDARSGEAVWRRDPRFAPSEDDDPAISTAPVVFDDRLFVQDTDGITVRNRLTGAIERDLGTDGCPALLADMLLVCGHGGVHAIDPVTLDVQWVNQEVHGWLHTAPAHHDGIAVGMLGFEANHIHGGVVVLDLATGAPMWTLGSSYRWCNTDPVPVGADLSAEQGGYNPDGPTDWLVSAPVHPVLADGRIWTVWDRQHSDDGWHERDEPWNSVEVVSFDPRTGAGLWDIAPDPVVDSYAAGAVAVTEGIVFMSTNQTGGGKLRAIDAATGQPRWVCRLGGTLIGQPVWVDGLIYVAGTRGMVHAVDAETGTVVWQVGIQDQIIDVYQLAGDQGAWHQESAPALLPSDETIFVRAKHGILALG